MAREYSGQSSNASLARRLAGEARLRGDRGDHQLHEHVESLGDAGGRPAGEESGRARIADQAVGKDQPRSRIAGRDGLSIQAGVMPALEQMRFFLVGYGCTTCIGNSGPLPAETFQGHRGS